MSRTNQAHTSRLSHCGCRSRRTQWVADSAGPSGAPLVILGRTIDAERSSRVTGWVLLPENFNGRVQVLVDDVVKDTVSVDGSFAINNVSAGARRLTFRGSSVAIRHVSLNVQTGESHLILVALRDGTARRGRSGVPLRSTSAWPNSAGVAAWVAAITSIVPKSKNAVHARLLISCEQCRAFACRPQAPGSVTSAHIFADCRRPGQAWSMTVPAT